jgi:hypothetical protein
MAITGNTPAFVANPWFIGGAVVVVFAIKGIIWWLYKKGKLPFSK